MARQYAEIVVAEPKSKLLGLPSWTLVLVGGVALYFFLRKRK